MRKFIASTAVAASVIGGGVLGAVVFTPAVSGAQETDDPAVTEEADTPQADAEQEGCNKGGGARLETIAEILGTDVDTLRTQLQNGATIAEIAGDQTDAVVDALVDAATERIDAAVEDGRLTDEEAAEKLAAAEERAEDVVNGEAPLRGPRGHRGHGGPGTGDAEAPADDVVAS